jgi:plasmid maintenance system antidote protein VapI
MGRYPATQRAIVGVLKDAIQRAGETATSVARSLGWPENSIRRVFHLQRDVSAAEFRAIARHLGIRASTLWERIERRLK